MSDYQFNPNAEQWKAIPGFPGYEISDHGGVRSYWGRISNGIGKGCRMVLSLCPQKYFGQYIGSSGYIQVRLRRDGRGYNKRVHQMILEVFVGPCPPGLDACHEDGNRLKNRLDNLRWDTRKSNIRDTKRHGTAPIGVKHGMAKLTEEEVIEIRRLHAIGLFHREIAVMFNVCPGTVGQIIRRKIWLHI